MTEEKFFLGLPVNFKKGLQVFPPLNKDVIANDDFSLYLKILTSSQEEIEDSFIEAEKEMEVYPTPFEFLLNNIYHNKEYADLAKEAFIFFTHVQPTFLCEQKMIIFGDISQLILSGKGLESLVYLTEADFFDFQNLIRQSVGEKIAEKPDPNEHPKIKAMKRKVRLRDRVKAKQNNLTLFSTLVSICCMGLGITPLNIGEMSYVATKSLVKKYQDKEKYDLDISSLLAGADSKKVKPEYWISNFKE